MEVAGRQAECPNCGGPIEWKLGTSGAAVCQWCRFSVVRTDRALEAIGKIADLVPTAPVMTVGDHGRIGQTGFLVGGRLQLDHGAGPWDEWYVGLEDGRWGWLAKAQGRWYVTVPVEAQGLPSWEQMAPGQSGHLPGGGDQPWTVTERGESTVVSAEGELPYPVRPNERGRYVDLQSPGGGFATIDYGDGGSAPIFFVGQQLANEQISFQHGGGAPVQKEMVDVSRLNCPTCGGPVPILVPDQTERAACPSCHSLLDFQQGNLQFLSQLDQPAVEPWIPLGTRGNLRGEEVLCIGFMERCTVVDGVTYAWREYLLHSQAGYRWLLEDSGHWTLVRPINPADVQVSGTSATFEGRSHKLFSTASTQVRFVIGEFYWKVQVGEQAQAADYIAPPFILSEERSAGEMQWSGGSYIEGKDVWEGFDLPGEPPRPYDVAPAQPNPVKVWPWVAMGLVFAVLLVGVFFLTKKSAPIQTYVDGPIQMPSSPDSAMAQRGASSSSSRGLGSTPAPASSGPSVNTSYTPPFQVPPSVDTVKVAMTSDLGHGWIGVAFALINETTGTMTEFTLEQDKFHSGGSARGQETSSATIGDLKPGNYVLRIDPRWARKSTSSDANTPPAANLRVSSTNPPDSSGCCCIAMVLILLPIPFSFIRKRLFESRRWRNSNLV